ncbi:MAG: DoxX family protein [Azonexus sp.]|jgi:putative oxidoreductase|nr:DoxX family protein [Betaproteobacteria bacterium]MBK8918067.1 DoxX family protein [Betaproteobacteria bacterium]MBP6036812.1 DoxX family protein [Azonexus sp.]MBP6907291.1 DoxX family protein [Azonexus sp.]
MKTLIPKGLETLDLVGLWIGLLSLRILLGWDFFESGLEKFHGDNWFADIQERFPFPFSLVPPEISWQMSTWFELVGGVALVLGIATRFFSVSLFVLTLVAIASVHWPDSWGTLGELYQGYGFTDKGFGNFKLPVLFLGMLLPLIFAGPGRLSFDYWVRRRFAAGEGKTARVHGIGQVAAQG